MIRGLVASLLLLCTAFVFRPALALISGTTGSPDGRPNAKANVSFRPPPDNPTTWGGGSEVQSDGTFEFTKVPPGHYYLTTGTLDPLASPAADPAAKLLEVKAGETAEIQLTK